MNGREMPAGEIDPRIEALINPGPNGEPAEYTICPCCYGHGQALIHDERFPDDPPRRIDCNHCEKHGVVPLDSRSMAHFTLDKPL